MLRAKVTITPIGGQDQFKNIEKGYRNFLFEKMQKWTDKLGNLKEFKNTVDKFRGIENIEFTTGKKKSNSKFSDINYIAKDPKFVSFNEVNDFITPKKVENLNENFRDLSSRRMPKLMPLTSKPHELYILPSTFPENKATKLVKKTRKY